jgi:hypothetical protein
LTNVGEGVGDGSLEESFGAIVETRIRGKVGIEGCERAKKRVFSSDQEDGGGAVPAFSSLQPH